MTYDTLLVTSDIFFFGMVATILRCQETRPRQSVLISRFFSWQIQLYKGQIWWFWWRLRITEGVKNHRICDHDLTRQGGGVSPAGDHTLLGFFCNASNLVVWLYEAPKKTLGKNNFMVLYHSVNLASPTLFLEIGYVRQSYFWHKS